MQGALAVGESGHEEPDAEGDRTDDQPEIAADATQEADPAAIAAHDLDPDRHLAQGGHRRGGVHAGVICHAQQHPDQIADQLDAHEGPGITGHPTGAQQGGTQQATDDATDDRADETGDE